MAGSSRIEPFQSRSHCSGSGTLKLTGDSSFPERTVSLNTSRTKDTEARKVTIADRGISCCESQWRLKASMVGRRKMSGERKNFGTSATRSTISSHAIEDLSTTQTIATKSCKLGPFIFMRKYEQSIVSVDAIVVNARLPSISQATPSPVHSTLARQTPISREREHRGIKK